MNTIHQLCVYALQIKLVKYQKHGNQLLPSHKNI